ncbi:MAG: hypothetical protein COT45_01790 [bacterium (Candidatus Stahlbacteria) CG08_land_8_20_14_0_20_40_26]|nr:MAG: hypothetical protein COX49_04235 [bacterium (Candidatus Stahlbacteria) CG23_combo_of_CG06-09_8_20_14_all_40_9]PIS25829.1 MAG: hypothetical protein COT45_01790 [bacterium (Candidatus Stahlbacteria) CG08_land_8_20_14_0_20_40_26]
MEFVYNPKTGVPSKVIADVKRKISNMVYSVNVFKVGSTGDYDQRFKYYERKGYDKMCIVYETSSLKYMGTIESELNAYYKDWETNINYNKGSGGPAPSKQVEKYYVYVVIQY